MIYSFEIYFSNSPNDMEMTKKFANQPSYKANKVWSLACDAEVRQRLHLHHYQTKVSKLGNNKIIVLWNFKMKNQQGIHSHEWFIDMVSRQMRDSTNRILENKNDHDWVSTEMQINSKLL